MQDLTVQEAADYLGVKRVTVYSNIRRGRILSYKRGVTIFIDKKEVKRWDEIRRR
jgi:excisionase family DNA binding protein